MIPVTQTVLHDPATGAFGNCFSAMLASLLHVPIEDVPVFCAADTWRRDVNEWLRPFGLAYLEFDGNLLAEQGRHFGIVGLHHEVAGQSPRHTDSLHSCVGQDGSLVFDPHPSRAGVTPIQYTGLFVALRPWEWKQTCANKQTEQDACHG